MWNLIRAFLGPPQININFILYSDSIYQVLIEGLLWIELLSLRTFRENLLSLPVFPQYWEILNQTKQNIHRVCKGIHLRSENARGLIVGPGRFNSVQPSDVALCMDNIYNWTLMSVLRGLPLKRSARVACRDFKMMWTVWRVRGGWSGLGG